MQQFNLRVLVCVCLVCYPLGASQLRSGGSAILMADDECSVEFKLVTAKRRRGVTAASSSHLSSPSASALPRGSHVTAAADTAHCDSVNRLVAPAGHLLTSATASSSRKSRRTAARYTTDTSETRLNKQLLRIAADVQILDCTVFMNALLNELGHVVNGLRRSTHVCQSCPPEVICYGLGSLRFGTNSRIQLAVLCCIRDCLASSWRSSPAEPSTEPERASADESVPCGGGASCVGKGFAPCRLRTLAFDPMFDEDDVAALRALEIEVISDNERGLRAAQQCTGHTATSETSTRSDCETVGRHLLRPLFLFMPHCNADLYENMLAANAGEGGGRLHAVTMVGNSLTWYNASGRDGASKGIRAPLELVEAEAGPLTHLHRFARGGLQVPSFALLSHATEDASSAGAIPAPTPSAASDSAEFLCEVALPTDTLDVEYERALSGTR